MAGTPTAPEDERGSASSAGASEGPANRWQANDSDREVSERPVGPASFEALMRTVVLLEDNDWSACTVDGKKEDWARYAESPVRGFCTIPAGRHRVVTEIDGHPVTLDFTLYPEAIYVKRLDRTAHAWVDLEPEIRARAEREASGGELGDLSEALVRYRSTMGISRAQSGEKLASPSEAVDAAMRDLTSALDPVTSPEREARAREAGERIIGVPLLRGQLDALVSLVLERVERAERQADSEKSAALMRAGLAALPDEPTLTRRLAKLLSASSGRLEASNGS